MGAFKETQREGLREINENSRETIDVGTEMKESADEINAVLESINLQDDEDIQGVREAKSSYQGSFDTAYNDQVETAGEQIEEKGEQLADEVNNEIGNVRDGIEKYNEAGGVSEIGRDAATEGASKLEQSESEYEEIVSEEQETVENMREQINQLKSELGGVFS